MSHCLAIFLENEGKCPNHIVVLHQGRIFKVVPFDEIEGHPWDIDRIEQVILQIENIAETKGPNSINSVGILTTLDRNTCLLYTSPSPRDKRQSRMPSSA